MKCQFTGTVEFRETQYLIPIPFNVWEVCEEIGAHPVDVRVGEVSFTCSLIPKGQGYYDIPVDEEKRKLLKPGINYPISFIMGGSCMARLHEGSPYGPGNPIRKIDGITLVTQPWDGLCGQCCVAMLAGITLDEAGNVMHCREWQANMSKMVETLDYLGLDHADAIVYTLGQAADFPKCCILMEKMGRYSHYLVKYEDNYYDPNMGRLKEFDETMVIGYLEVKA